MYHTLPAREFLDLSYRDDVCFIINRILRPLAPTEAQEAYTLMLAARSHGCQHWLIDLRRHSTYQPELLTTFFPQPHDQPGKLTYLAYLVSPMLLDEITTNGNIPQLTHHDNLPYRVCLFVDEREAQQWLIGNS